jgi:nucleoid-associated protein YgaU
MGIELVRESFTVDKIMARAIAQAAARDSREIPTAQPGLRSGTISAVLRVDKEARIDEVRVSDDLVEVDGRVDVEILYVGDDDRSAEQFVRRRLEPLQFTKAIEVEGMTHEMVPRAEAFVRVLDVVARSAHRLDLDAVVDLSVTGVLREKQEVTTGVSGVPPEQLSVETEPLRVTDRVGSGATSYLVTANRSLPSGYPPILLGQTPVIAVTAAPRVLDSTVQDDKVRVEGELDVTVVYQADPEYCDPSYPVYSATFSGLGFAQTIGVPGAVPHNRAIPEVRVLSAEASRVTGDVFDIDVALNVSVDVVDVREIDALVSVESLGPEIVDVERRHIRTYNTVSEEKAEAMLTGTVELPDGFPAVYGGDERGILAKTADVKIDSCRPGDGRVTIEGTFDIDIVYAAETTLDEEFENRDNIPPVRSVRFEDIPFEYAFDVSEAGAGMIGEAWASVVDLEIEPMSDRRRIEYSAVVDIGIRVIEVRQVSVVTDCELVTPQERDPAVITFYVVQSGDSLWSIARRYKITVDSLAKANRLEDREGLKPGSRLLIPAI